MGWREWVPNALLFVATAGSVYTVGEAMREGGGVQLVASLMGILLAHEMGHYVACRRYGVDATLPYFIPFPVLSLSGTLGAFIAIRSRFPDRRALFDIGIAGPLAGFVVCVPVLALGILDARVMPAALFEGPDGLSLGEPLLFQWMARWLLGPLPDGQVLVVGPLGMAGWFGLLVTALNLMPIGQLDGGHVTYALFRRAAMVISRVALALTLVLLWLRPTWLMWSIVLLVLTRPHPPTLDDRPGLGAGRKVVAGIGAVVFALCFTPSPFEVTWGQFLDALAELASLVTSRS
ncbi:MAG TPA: site-2 protease family protein [Vicinamibacteria bacterium]|nr:site-2 protease family protein [Vicinamibacteria bacterium]